VSLTSFYYFSVLVLWETYRPKRNTLVYFYIVADDRSFTYYNTCTVVNKKVLAYFCPWMYSYAPLFSSKEVHIYHKQFIDISLSVVL